MGFLLHGCRAREGFRLGQFFVLSLLLSLLVSRAGFPLGLLWGSSHSGRRRWFACIKRGLAYSFVKCKMAEGKTCLVPGMSVVSLLPPPPPGVVCYSCIFITIEGEGRGRTMIPYCMSGF